MMILQKLINYIKESKTEMEKVIWPNKEETKNYTLMVIGISLGVALFLGILDYIFTQILKRIL
jgi:preprotein translocase subunit SecE